ncbi:MAG: hypothetical protein FWE35_15525 [Streptosporangiales bacterium]|nr:hypothetical protein [Streptosporangiales bacterium]
MRSRSTLAILAAPFLLTLALAGCGPASASPAASSSAPAAVKDQSAGASSPASAHASVPASSSASSAGSASPAASGSAAGQPAGGPVPGGFAAASATWVSADEGYVLGTAPCSKAPCTSVLRTTDRGASWKGLPAPVVPLGRLGSANPEVWGIRFATPLHGFVFGTELQETTDGGEHWHPVDLPVQISDPSFVSLEITGGQVLALMEQCVPGKSCSGHGLLMRRPLSGGGWQQVAQVTAPSAIGAGSGMAAVLNGSRVLTTSDGGQSLASYATPCTNPDTDGAVAVAVTGPKSLALLCAGGAAAGSVRKTVYVSSDGGAQWTKAGSPAPGGDPYGIAGGTASRLVVGADSGASWLYSSANGGRTWGTAFEKGDGGMGFNDLGFTNSGDGSVVYAPVTTDDNGLHDPGRLLLTGDGGSAWHVVTW